MQEDTMMKRTFTALVAAASLYAFSAAAQPPASPTPGNTGCLRLGQIDGFNAIRGNGRAFVVTDKLHRRFRINLVHDCGDLDLNLSVGFQTLEGGRLACISRGDTVINRDPARAGSRCPIASVEIYTPAMEAADKAAAQAMKR
jgi:hypothetical protein